MAANLMYDIDERSAGAFVIVAKSGLFSTDEFRNAPGVFTAENTGSLNMSGGRTQIHFTLDPLYSNSDDAMDDLTNWLAWRVQEYKAVTATESE